MSALLFNLPDFAPKEHDVQTNTMTRIRRPQRTIIDLESGERTTIRIAPPGRSNARRKAIREQEGR